MIQYNEPYKDIITVDKKSIYVFPIRDENIDKKTVESFGEEWTKFDFFTDEEIKTAGDQYFDIIPDEYIKDKYVMDVGCGTGRWTKYVAAKAKFVESVDPSAAVYTAAKFMNDTENVRISMASVDNIPFADDSFDLVFSLGVLHHIPDTRQAMKDCVKKVKKGGYFMVYLYYSLDNRGFLFKLLFRLSNIIRVIISALPSGLKKFICDVIAVCVYMPFVLLTKLFKAIGLKKLVKYIPLSYYADKSFNIIKNDALDRFGTPLEQRFSRKEIKDMMESCGLTNVVFSEHEPYWHAVGQKA
jgi:SAM-dependent methyltransferase